MLDYLNTFAAIGTFLVIGTTAIAALIQLRHMRAANQLEGLLTVLARVEDVNFNRWFTQAQRELPDMLADPAYRRGVAEGTFDRTVSWLSLGNSYDWVGSLVKNRLIPEDAFLDVYSYRVIRAWELLEDITAIVRRGAGEATWENFEYLYVRSREWDRRYPNGNYPKNAEHAVVRDRFAELDAQQS
ncbi:MAG: DUF4760 domain-containing protein [Vulcanimicrobiaceae bacterium]